MAAPNEYSSGTRVELTAAFTNNLGAPIDPTLVTFRYIDPDSGAIVTLVFGTDPEITNPEVGTYKLNLDVVSEGMWIWRAEGTDTPEVSGDSKFKVLSSPFVPG